MFLPKHNKIKSFPHPDRHIERGVAAPRLPLFPGVSKVKDVLSGTGLRGLASVVCFWMGKLTKD